MMHSEEKSQSSSAVPRMPNLFIVGAPKCGTSAMSSYLAAHPDIFMSEEAGVKEPGYFATDAQQHFGRRKINTRESYLDLFRTAPPCARYLGEASVAYLPSTVAIPNILAVSPEARLVVMVRNPVEIAQRLHNQRLKEATEPITSFERAWHYQDARRKGRHLPSEHVNPQALLYGELAKVGTQLERLLQLAPRRQICVLLYDDFAENPANSYQTLLTFLALENDGRNSFPIVNPSVEFHSRSVPRAMAWAKGTRKRLHIRGGWGIHRAINRYSTRTGIAPLRPAFHDELQNYFRSEIVLLSRILERNLSYWLD